MGSRHCVRVSERCFLNLPGFHRGAYVLAYLEDTSDRQPGPRPYCDDECPKCPHNFEPKMMLEIADCDRRVSLEFGMDQDAERVNSLHKLDTLIAALDAFRAGLVEEFREYERRERELEARRE
jgi:hypothetical protein